MRLVRFLKETSLINQLRNNVVDDRDDNERSEDEEEGYTYPNPLPHISPNNPQWMDWFDRAEVPAQEYLDAHNLPWRGNIVKAKMAISQPATLPIDQLISSECFFRPDALQRQAGDKFSSNRPFLYKVDGHYIIADGNHRIVQAHLNGESEIDVDLIDVDAYEGRAA